MGSTPIIDLATVDKQQITDYLDSKNRRWVATDDPDIISANSQVGEVLIALNNARVSSSGSIIVWRYRLITGWNWAYLPSVTHFLISNE